MLLSRCLLLKAVLRSSRSIQGGIQQLVISAAREPLTAHARFLSDHENLPSNNDENLLNLAKNISNSITTDSQKEQFIARFNLNKEIIEHFKVISNDTVTTEEWVNALLNIRETLDDCAIGILEEVCVAIA